VYACWGSCFILFAYVMSDWTADIEGVLEQIRINSVLLSKEHKKRYFYLTEILN
jgi:hypothetical protein